LARNLRAAGFSAARRFLAEQKGRIIASGALR
jgi:hypothetical protein